MMERARIARIAAAIFAGFLLGSASAQPSSGDPISSAELERILGHGPWPPPARRDPSNRMSGKREAILLGERLFFSPRLSGTGGILCASCHETWRGFSDGRPRAVGIAPVDRNTQSLTNVRLNRWFGWDGANDTLWSQSIRPLLEPREMRASPAHVAALVRGDPELSGLYERVFGATPPASDEALLVDVGKALAAYQETLASDRTPFDDFRDALARRDFEAASRYPVQARRGLRIFIGKGACSGCHSGPNFSDGEFHRTGVASLLQNGEADTGRQAGIRKLLAGRYNLLGAFNDDPSRATAGGTRAASAERDTMAAFRTPSLRDLTLTAPYMHDGSAATLCDVAMRHPADDAQGANVARGSGRVKLSQDETRDLVAFLETLTAAPGRRFPGDSPTLCR